MLAVAVDRWIIGAHYISDIVGGALLGALVATVALLAAGVEVPVPHELVTETGPQQGRRAAELGPRRRAAVIFNPTKVTDWVTFRRHVEYELKSRGWDRALWLETTTDDPGRAMTEQAVREGVDLVLGAGGDGTIRVICSGLAGTGIPFGLIPAGTGNLLAKNIGIPLDEAAALDVAFDGVDKAVDLVQLTVDGGPPDHFAVMAGIGIDAVIMEGTDPNLKKAVGSAAYFVVRGAERQPPGAAGHDHGRRRAAAQAQGARHRDRQRRVPAGQHPADPGRPGRRRAARRAGRLAADDPRLGPADHPGAHPADGEPIAQLDRLTGRKVTITVDGRDQFQIDGDTVGECSTMTAEVDARRADAAGAAGSGRSLPTSWRGASTNGARSRSTTRNPTPVPADSRSGVSTRAWSGTPAAVQPTVSLEALQPGGGGGVVGVRGADLDDRLGPVGPGVAAQEDHVAADPVQSHHGLGQPGVVDMALGVDGEAVVAQAPLGRPRLDPAQVDARGWRTARGSPAAHPGGSPA